ncbi:MAG: hypothetical protein LUP94_00075 [Candidatus Methanomethylicus sp.]|nr:hypothetical protein [Candidatus Methanomethylicus sp.]
MEKTSLKKVKGGKLVKVSVRSTDGIIEKVTISGDFFAYPEEGIEQIEKELRGANISMVRSIIDSAAGGVVFVGVNRGDLVEMVEECLE